MYYIYILQSIKDKKFYTGLTKNLTRRINEHNNKYVTSTKNRVPFNLVYFERAETLKVARQREKFLKTGNGREFRDKILKYNIPR